MPDGEADPLLSTTTTASNEMAMRSTVTNSVASSTTARLSLKDRNEKESEVLLDAPRFPLYGSILKSLDLGRYGRKLSVSLGSYCVVFFLL